MSEEKRTPEERLSAVEARSASTERYIRRGLRGMILAGVIFVVSMALTAWQIDRAFSQQDSERLARIGASASINTFLCQRIDSVGNGVASLVRVSLQNSPPPEELEPLQRAAYFRFLSYAEAQERPPRCRELALKIATLTGADPTEIRITPIRLHDRKGE